MIQPCMIEPSTPSLVNPRVNPPSSSRRLSIRDYKRLIISKNMVVMREHCKYLAGWYVHAAWTVHRRLSSASTLCFLGLR